MLTLIQKYLDIFQTINSYKKSLLFVEFTNKIPFIE